MPTQTLVSELGNPVMTWNFYLTAILVPVCVAALGSWISYKAKSYYKVWEDLTKLREENDKHFKEESLRDRENLRQALVELKDKKADRSELVYDKNELWRRVNSHYHLIDCAGEGCDARKTGEVIIPHDNAT